MISTLKAALAALDPVVDSAEYIVVKLPPRAITAAAGIVAEISEPFCALVVDGLEVTLVVPVEAVELIQRLPGYVAGPERYRLITLNTELDLNLVGFMARVSQALADVDVALLPFGAFSRDHLLVQTGQVSAALEALERLRSQYQ